MWSGLDFVVLQESEIMWEVFACKTVLYIGGKVCCFALYIVIMIALKCMGKWSDDILG